MNIPDAAAEAVARAFYGTALDDVSPEDLEHAMLISREALQAALPHLSEEVHFGCPDCGEREGCDCRWKDVL